MSNAAVINATNSSGHAAGAPIAISTGGDVALKLYGTGTGSWSVTAAFAPSVGGVVQAPTTLTITNDSPRAVTSTISTGATEWVGWIMASSGTWEASGIVEGYTGDEALANYLGDFASFAALPAKAVKTGARATVGAESYVYNGAQAGWVEVRSMASTGNRWVWDGDSITNGFNGVQTVAAILNGKMVIAGNVAAPGQRLDEILARIGATLAYKPDGIWLMAGTNDAGIGRTPADFAVLLNAYIDKVLGSGIQLILSLIPPRSDANNLNAQKINVTIRRVAGLRGVPLCDPWETFRANDGTWVAGASGDLIHPYAHILVPAAQSANAQLSGWLNSIPSIYPPLAQPDGGLRANNLFLTDTNGDGLADGINAGAGATNTLSTASLPKLGKVQRCAWSAYAGDSNFLVFGGAANPGDKILAIGRISYDPQGSTNNKLEVKFIGDYGAKTHGYLFGGAGANFRDAFSGVYAIEFTTVAGSTSADMNPSMNRVSGGTVTGFLELSQVQFYNLTALGLA